MKIFLIFVFIFVLLKECIAYNETQWTKRDPGTDRRQQIDGKTNRFNNYLVSIPSREINGKQEFSKDNLRNKKINNNNNYNNRKLSLQKNHKSKTVKKQSPWQEIEMIPFKSKNIIDRKQQRQQQQQQPQQQSYHSHENECNLIDFYENSENVKENFSAAQTKTTRAPPKETDKGKFPIKQKRPLMKSARQFASNNNNNGTQATNKMFNEFQRKRFISRKLFDQTSSTLLPFGHKDHFARSWMHDFKIFFQAERDTIFRLHTAIGKSNRISRSDTKVVEAALPKPYVFHALSNKIGAAFGAQTGIGAVGIGVGGGGDYGDVTVKSRTEIVKLHDVASLRLSHFNPLNPTRILIHGWMGSSRAGVYSAIVPEYLRRADTIHYNIFTLDWGRGAVADYITASYRVKAVGETLAKFLDFLYREAGINFRDVYLIGFSMGAHVAGIAGKHLETGRLAAIYALDPALQFFHYHDAEERLDVGDADYVEVIHTNVGAYGYDRPLGHVDFYVNFGNNQPGCFFNECNHMRAFQVFAESLRRRNRSNIDGTENNVAGTTDGILGEGCETSLWQDLIRNRRCLSKTKQTLVLGELPYREVSGATELEREQHRIEMKQRRGVYYTATTTTITR